MESGVDEPAAQAAAPAGVTPEAIAKGDTIYHKTGLCYACHGANGEGTVGPKLSDAEWIHGDGSYDMIVATVTAGVPKEKAKSGIVMPPKGGSSISDEDVKFERLELPPIEEERDDSRERQLGLIEPERRERGPESMPMGGDMMDDGDIEAGEGEAHEEEEG